MKKPTLFLSYAHEDCKLVEDYYGRLSEEGFSPWMDSRDLLPGEKWEPRIRRAVRDSDFFLAFLSPRSVQKRGVLQKEIRWALDRWTERLEEDIYLIPVRLESCEVPEPLRGFQWVDLGDADGWSRLLRALRDGSERWTSREKAAAEEIRIVATSKKVEETAKAPVPYSIELDYPSFRGEPDQALREVNARIDGFVTESLQSFRKLAAPWMPQFRGWFSELESWISLSYRIHLLTSQLISIEFMESSYGAGAAHGMHRTVAFNYALRPAVELCLTDIFEDNSGFLDHIATYCLEDLLRQAGWGDEANSSQTLEPEDTIRDGAAPRPENYQTFTLTARSLVIIFREYQVGSYAWGIRRVEIPWHNLTHFLRKGSPLHGHLFKQDLLEK